VEIISSLTTTLERDELLSRIMAYACDLLNVEATSIWLRDKHQGDLVLHLASGKGSERMDAQRVPSGHGIIGHVVDTGRRWWSTMCAKTIVSTAISIRRAVS
jgi:GAF domain-containing protein